MVRTGRFFLPYDYYLRDAFRLLRCRHLGNKLDFNVKPLTKEISTQSMEIFSDVKSDTCSSTLSMMEVDEDSSTQSEHNRIRNLSTVTFGAAAQQNETQAAEDWRQEKSHLLEVVESANVRYDLLVGTLKTILNGNCTFPPIFQDDDEEELHVVQVPKSILKVPTVTGESSQSTAPSPTIRGTTSAKKINWDESVQLLEKLRQEKLRNEAFVFGYKINGTVDILTDEEMSSDEYENASSSDQSIDVVSRVQIDSLESFAKTAPSVSLFSGRRPRPPKEEINLPKSLDTQPVDLPPVTSPQPEPLKSIIPKSKLSKRLSTLKFWEKENSKTDVKKHTFDFKYKQTTSSNKTEKEHFVVDNQPQQNQIVPGNDISAMLMEDGEVQEQVVMELPGSPPIIENESLDVIDEGEISLKRPKPVIKKRFWGRNGKKEGKE